MEKINLNCGFLDEAKQKKNLNVVIITLLFLAVFLVGQFASVFIALPFSIVVAVVSANADVAGNGFNDDAWNMIIILFSTIATTILSIITVKFILKRKVTSMGFIKKGWFKQYLVGLLVGFVMFSVAVLICFATGTLEYAGFTLSGGALLLVLFFFGFVVQGMSEEVVCRGLFMPTLAAKTPVIIAIIANSLVFAAAHLLNSGIGVLPIINLTLFGIFASVYMIKTNNIWGISAIHSIWNFVQGNFYGIKVSGNETAVSVFSFTSTENGEIINGGAFGLEGGISVSIVLIVATVIMLFYKKKEAEELA